MKKILLFTTFLLFYSCDLFESNGFQLPDEKVYVALQGLDQIGIVDVVSGNIEHIDIDYGNMNCMDYASEDTCRLTDGCEWMMNHCMELADECVGIVDENQCMGTDGCEWMMNHCMESSDMMDMGNHTPHFIVIDEINGYWFVTTITSGYVGRHDLETDVFIDNIMVGDSPALLALNEENKKLYVSRMMPMAGMMTGSISTKVQEIDYSRIEIQKI